jgi:hypothetical protein
MPPRFFSAVWQGNTVRPRLLSNPSQRSLPLVDRPPAAEEETICRERDSWAAAVVRRQQFTAPRAGACEMPSKPPLLKITMTRV